MIEKYEFGSIKINGKTYDHDVIVWGDQIKGWWRKEGHYVDIEDLKDLPEKFGVLVFGNGASGVCEVPDKTIQYIKEKGAEVIVQMTGQAVQTYNKLLSEGKSVVGAFHLTC